VKETSQILKNYIKEHADLVDKTEIVFNKNIGIEKIEKIENMYSDHVGEKITFSYIIDYLDKSVHEKAIKNFKMHSEVAKEKFKEFDKLIDEFELKKIKNNKKKRWFKR
jgi:uncharacterized membrane protein